MAPCSGVTLCPRPQGTRPHVQVLVFFFEGQQKCIVGGGAEGRRQLGKNKFTCKSQPAFQLHSCSQPSRQYSWLIPNLWFGKPVLFFSMFAYLFLETGWGREMERERHIDVWEKHPLVASRMPPTGDIGFELGTLCFASWHSIHWAIPARAESPFLTAVLFIHYNHWIIYFFVAWPWTL